MFINDKLLVRNDQNMLRNQEVKRLDIFVVFYDLELFALDSRIL